MKKTVSILALIIVIAFVSCTSGNQKQKKNNDNYITVAQWGQEKYLIYLPFYVAIEKGFFEEIKLNVSIKYSGNDDQVFATVLTGDAQFGIGDPVFTAIARERKAKGKVIASLVNGVAIWGVTNKNLDTINALEDLAGLRVGTFPEPSTNFALMKKTILKGGDKLKSTKIVQAPIGSQLALLENGSADIAMELEPGTSLAESKGYKVIYSSSKFYGPFAFTGVTTTEEYISENPETVQQFVNCIEKALRFCHENESETIDIALGLFPNLDTVVVKNAVNRMIKDKTIAEHALMSDEAWQKALQIRIEIGDLKKPQSTIESVNNLFAEKALNITNTHK